MKNRQAQFNQLLVASILVAAQTLLLVPAATGQTSSAAPHKVNEADGEPLEVIHHSNEVMPADRKPFEHKAVEHKEQANREKLEPVTAKIEIAAPLNVVWQVVHEERKHDPDLAYSKVLSEKNNDFMLEQKFCLIPVIGTSVCQMHQRETPNTRIDYKLVKSDRFKVMEGSWVLIPSADKQSTTLELTTTLDLGMPVPHAVLNHVTLKKLEHRLHNIKRMAEKSLKHASVAATGKEI